MSQTLSFSQSKIRYIEDTLNIQRVAELKTLSDWLITDIKYISDEISKQFIKLAKNLKDKTN